jgi:hypothetical protein
VATATVNAYERRPFAWLGGTPESVARTIERAPNAKRPRTRYLVTPSARLVLGLHGLLPDRLWDRMLQSSYPGPGA